MGHLAGLPEPILQSLASVWNAKPPRPPALKDRFQQVLRACSCPPFGVNDRLYRDVVLLIEFRNLLVHYKPQTVSTVSEHNIASKLHGKFALNSMIHGSQNALYPDKLLGAGCAKWASTTVE
jgi:hypothetical protein